MIEFLTTVMLGLGLAMDAFAVSITNGLCYKDMRTGMRITMAASFGLFQGIMPALGYFTGNVFAEKIKAIDHWVAFVLLAGIGINMIAEAIKENKSHKKGESYCEIKKLTITSLLVQSVATSIDAFAVGISLALAGASILTSAVSIAVITFLCCLAGVYIGTFAGGALKDKAQIAGGIVLIFIGLKILIEHLFF